MTCELDLDRLDEHMKPGAIRAFEEGDGAAFVMSGYSVGQTLHLVVDNWNALEERGILPAALVHGFSGCKINHHQWSAGYIHSLFKRCARRFGFQALRDIGAPLDSEQSLLTVYRGVSGSRQYRRIRGMSWTSSLDVACFFSGRWVGPDPAVYVATVRAKSIFCHFVSRDEDEYIVRPSYPKRLKITVEEMQRRARCFRSIK